MKLALRLSFLSVLSGLLLLPAGCAKAPGGSDGATSPVSGPQLFVTMTVKGTINPNYYYYVLFNINDTPGPGGTSLTGPVPVVAPPYGNGFAAGAFTNYVQFHGTNGGTGFGYYAISADLLTPSYRGSTGYLIQSSVSGSTISFQIPLAQVVPLGSNLTVDSINQLEVNFVTTNVVNVIGDSLTTPKYFDALNLPTSTGSFVDLNVRSAGGAVQQGLYNDATTNNEGELDVATLGNSGPVSVNYNSLSATHMTSDNPPISLDDLDIIDWSIRLNPQ